MLGKLAECFDSLARTTRDQDQRIGRATSGVYEELRAGVDVGPSAIQFSRKELALPLSMSEAERQRGIDAPAGLAGA